jgi:hypothetical protein
MVYEFRLCSVFISVLKNVNMIKWFEEEEELEKQRNLSDSSVSSLFLQVSQVTFILIWFLRM